MKTNKIKWFVMLVIGFLILCTTTAMAKDEVETGIQGAVVLIQADNTGSRLSTEFEFRKVRTKPDGTVRISRRVRRVTSDTIGHFFIQLREGTYQISSPTTPYRSSLPFVVTVYPDRVTGVRISFFNY